MHAELSCLIADSFEILLPDSFCFGHEIHSSPAMHHAFSDMYIKFHSTLAALCSEVIKISDHHLIGPVEYIYRRESGEIEKYRAEEICIISCCKYRSDVVEESRRNHHIKMAEPVHFSSLLVARRHLKSRRLQHKPSRERHIQALVANVHAKRQRLPAAG